MRDHKDYQEVIRKYLDSLCKGIEPITGEKFDPNALVQDIIIRSRLAHLYSLSQTELKQKTTYKEDKEQRIAIKRQKLKQWRTLKASERNLPAYCILHDSTINSIAETKINRIEDLLSIKGIGLEKFNIYGEEIFELCNEITTESLEGKKEVKKDLTDEDKKLLMEIKKVESDIIETSCKNCMLYISEECCGDQNICELYKYSPNVSRKEINSWPKFGDATYFRLHSRKRK